MEVKMSEKIDEQIKKMFTGYLDLMLECSENQETREKFLNDPEYRLERINQTGMHIDTGKNNVKVLIEKKLGWPLVYIKREDEKILVAEKKLGLEVVRKWKNSGENDQIAKLQNQGELEVDVAEALKDCDVVVKVPFIDLKDDVLTEIKFKDENEILLTMC